MGKFSLEFGRKGPEGLKEEHDEKIFSDTLEGDGSEIGKVMQGVDTSMDEEDYSDCEKQPEELEEESYDDCGKKPDEEEKEDTFEDCLKKATKSKAETLREDAEEYRKRINRDTDIVEKYSKTNEDMNKSILDIFG